MAKQASSPPSSPAPPLPFEEAIAELESIVKEMESERMPLDQLVQRYERGSQLLKTCQKRLKEAEQRIEMIASGSHAEEVSLEPFDPEAPATAPAPAPRKPARRAEKAEPDESDEISLF